MKGPDLETQFHVPKTQKVGYCLGKEEKTVPVVTMGTIELKLVERSEIVQTEAKYYKTHTYKV